MSTGILKKVRLVRTYLSPVRLRAVYLQPGPLESYLPEDYTDFDVLRASSAYSDDGTEFPDDTVFINDGRMVAEPQGENKCLVEGFPGISVAGIQVNPAIAGDATIESIIDKLWYSIEITSVATGQVANILGSVGNINPHSWGVYCFVSGLTAGDISAYLNVGSEVIVGDSPSRVLLENEVPASTGRRLAFISNGANIGAKINFILPQLSEYRFLGSVVPSDTAGPTLRSPTTLERQLLTQRTYGLINGVADGVELVPTTPSSFTPYDGTNGVVIIEVGVYRLRSDGSTFVALNFFGVIGIGEYCIFKYDEIDSPGSGNIKIVSPNPGETILSNGSEELRFVSDNTSMEISRNVGAAIDVTFSVSLQKVAPIDTAITWSGQIGADQSILTGDLNILATDGGEQDIIYLDALGNLKSTDGTNTATVALNAVANTDYWFRVEAASATFKVGYSTDGINYTYSADTTFNGFFPVAGTVGVDAQIEVPYCGIAGPEIPVKTKSVTVLPL